jgi:hypothetical protein
MLNQTKLFTVLLTATAMLAVSSCKKETITTKQQNSTAQLMEAKKIANQLFSFAVPAGSSSVSFKNGNFDCATITVDSSSGYVKTFDYGNGCADDAGIVRKGSITATYNNENIQSPGTIVSLSFNNFFINNDEVTGSMSIENTGASGNGNWVIRFAANCQDHSPVNGETQMDALQYFEWVAGGNTSDYTDDVFSVTGSFTATTLTNEQCAVTVQQPLVVKTMSGCNEHFVEGITFTQTTGEDDVYLDYGDGTCDNLAVRTVNGNSETIVLE